MERFRDRLEQSAPERSLYKLILFLRPQIVESGCGGSGIMKPRSIAIALAFCVSLVSTPLVSASYAQMQEARQQRLVAVGKQLFVTSRRSDCSRFWMQRSQSCERLETTLRSPGLKNSSGS